MQSDSEFSQVVTECKVVVLQPVEVKFQCILMFSYSGRWMVSSPTVPTLFLGTRPPYKLDTRVVRPQSCCGCSGEEANLCCCC